jgi:catechol 2,3-dioxygenase-like lactoylglutathione lyase family enzyme
MPLGSLQHYTIEPADLERTKDFYCDVLGLENGDRPPLDFPGYWLYSGGHRLSATARSGSAS